MVEDYLDYYMKVCSKLDVRPCKDCKFENCPYKSYKEKSSRPFSEIPMSDKIDKLEKKSVRYRSEEEKKYREKTKKKAGEQTMMIIKRLHKNWEKAIYNLYFVDRKPYEQISEELKMTIATITKRVKILKKKIPKINQTFELFTILAEKFKEYLTKEQYEVFELYYNKWMSYFQIGKKLNLGTQTIGDRIRNGEKRLGYKFGWARFKFEKEDWENYIQLKKIRKE